MGNNVSCCTERGLHDPKKDGKGGEMLKLDLDVWEMLSGDTAQEVVIKHRGESKTSGQVFAALATQEPASAASAASVPAPEPVPVPKKDRNRNKAKKAKVRPPPLELEKTTAATAATAERTMPVCSKCGYGFASERDMLELGEEAFHKTCPDPEGAGCIPAPARAFVHKAPERLCLAVRCAPGTEAKTFTFKLEEATRITALEPPAAGAFVLLYNAEFAASLVNTRKVELGGAAPSFSATVRQDDFSSTDPDEADQDAYEPVPGVQYHGPVKVQGEVRYMKLTFDGELVHGESKPYVIPPKNVTRVSVKVRDNVSVSFLPATEEPGFALAKQGKEHAPFLTVKTFTWALASIWVHSILRIQMDGGRPAQEGHERITLHLFKKRGGVTQRLELTAQFDPKASTLACCDSVRLYVARFDGAASRPSPLAIPEAPPPPASARGMRRRSSSRGFVKDKLRLWGEKFLGEEIDDFLGEDDDGPLLSPKSSDIVKEKLRTWASARIWGSSPDLAQPADSQPLSPRTRDLVGEAKLGEWDSKIDEAKATLRKRRSSSVRQLHGDEDVESKS